MKVDSRLLDCQDKIMLDSTGVLYEGERVVNFPDPESPLGFIESCIKYHHGKIHCDEDYAVYFVDGHKEWWINGRFISATPAYKLLKKMPFD